MHPQPRGIAATTGVLAILGHPVAHSRSPQIHSAAFAAQGLDLVYVACDVLPAALPAAVTGLRALGIRGANVTVPHKEAIIPLLDDVDALARQVGAVNTIKASDGRLLGTNTDVPGFLAALQHLWPDGPAGRRCLVLGAGGAGRAVVAALVSASAEVVYLYNRTAERAIRLCGDAAGWGTTACRPLRVDELGGQADEVDLIVNATSVGLGDGFKVDSLPVDIVTTRHVVVDLVYGDAPTAFIRQAKERGALAMDGREMLLQQAAVSYEYWTGRKAPIDVMRDELLRN